MVAPQEAFIFVGIFLLFLLSCLIACSCCNFGVRTDRRRAYGNDPVPTSDGGYIQSNTAYGCFDGCCADQEGCCDDVDGDAGCCDGADNAGGGCDGGGCGGGDCGEGDCGGDGGDCGGGDGGDCGGGGDCGDAGGGD